VGRGCLLHFWGREKFAREQGSTGGHPGRATKKGGGVHHGSGPDKVLKKGEKSHRAGEQRGPGNKQPKNGAWTKKKPTVPHGNVPNASGKKEKEQGAHQGSSGPRRGGKGNRLCYQPRPCRVKKQKEKTGRDYFRGRRKVITPSNRPPEKEITST